MIAIRTHKNALLDAALDLVRQGLSVIPVAESKKSLVPWKTLQVERATHVQVRDWFASCKVWGLAIVTGAVSGVVVLDIDGQAGFDALAGHGFHLPPTIRVETPRGVHLYFEAPVLPTRNFTGGTKTCPLSQVDFRGDRGYAVAPPTPGYAYVEKLPLAPMPEWLKSLTVPGWDLLEEAIENATEGTRNDIGFALACKLRDTGLTEECAKRLMQAFADAVRHRGTPPYTQEEALASLQSAYSKPPRAPRPGGEESAGPDDDALQVLAKMAPLDYDRERESAASRLGVRVSTLDGEVARRRSPATESRSSREHAPTLKDIAPAADPVDGDKLLDDLVAAIRRYIVSPPHGAVATALWVLRAHAHDAFDVNPRLALISPLPRCGKAFLLEILTSLTPRALISSNITPAVVFRIIEAASPTFLIDEFDSFKNRDEDLRGILNSGHRRTAAFVLRCVGEDHQVKAFSTWCPMAFAAIDNLPDTLQDRSIIIRMRRRAKNEKVARLRWSGRQGEALRESLDSLARACARWVADHADALREADPVIPDGLNDRAGDNWSALLAIADRIGGDWPDRARAAAVALSGEREEENDSIKIELLHDVRTVFHESHTDRMASQVLCERLAKMEEGPWSSWKRGHPMTPAQLARLLRQFEIRSRDIWIKDRGVKKCVKGYVMNEFTDAFERYLPALFAPSTPAEGVSDREAARLRAGSGDDADFRSARGNGSRVSENHTKPAPDVDSRALAAEKGVTGRDKGNGALSSRLAELSSLWSRVEPRFETDGVGNGVKPPTDTNKRR